MKEAQNNKKVQSKKPLLKFKSNTCVWKEFGEQNVFGHVGTDPYWLHLTHLTVLGILVE